MLKPRAALSWGRSNLEGSYANPDPHRSMYIIVCGFDLQAGEFDRAHFAGGGQVAAKNEKDNNNVAQGRTYHRFFLLLSLLQHIPLDTVLLHAIAFYQCVPMTTSNPVCLTISTIAIDTLNGVVLLPSGSWMSGWKCWVGGEYTKRLRISGMGTTVCEERGAAASIVGRQSFECPEV